MDQVAQKKPVKVGMISLGCAKNLVDAEIMLGSLLKDGVEITNDASDADVVIVNTCSFIDSAQEESVDTILESAALRDSAKPNQGLVVSGCLPQRFRDELPKLLPEVDAFIGIDQVENIGKVVQQAHELRARRLAPKPKAGGKSKVMSQLTELEKGKKQGAHEEEENLRGTPAFGQTRKVVGKEALPAHFDVTQRPTYIPDFQTPRFRLTPRHFAYVKIAEGCNHPCSFCIIPRMRGGHRSRGQSDIVAEARELVAQGVREINLISQDSTYYGLDLRPERAGSIASPEKFTAAARSLPVGATTLCTLLRELNAIPGDFWIRLLYTHPAHWTDELIQTIADCPKVARYVDMPLQHIHPTMLERMRRETSREHIEQLIQKIRRGIPGITLRTTFIVGFPGETQAYFDSLLQFIRDTRFERMGVFTYSHEEGTRAAGMSSQVADEVKQERKGLAMAEQRRICRELSTAKVGQEIRVLLEHKGKGSELKAEISSWEHGLIREGEKLDLKGQVIVARGEPDAPDIDGRVYIQNGRGLELGGFAQVKVVGHTDYDLIARPV